MTFRGLQGKVALVTGGGSGIGAGTAVRLSAEGAAVAVIDRDLDAARRVADQLSGRSLALRADVSDAEDVARAFDATVSELGGLDLLHLNAGISGPFGTLATTTADDFDTVVRVNLRGAFLGLKEGFRILGDLGHPGAIVLTASVAGLRGSPEIAPYVATKHGVVGLTKSAAVQGAATGIRVNAIAPGVIDTAMQAPLLEALGGGDTARNAMHRTSPAGRMGTVEEVSSLVAFLLSDEAPFITGTVVTIDGGVDADSPIKLSP